MVALRLTGCGRGGGSNCFFVVGMVTKPSAFAYSVSLGYPKTLRLRAAPNTNVYAQEALGFLGL